MFSAIGGELYYAIRRALFHIIVTSVTILLSALPAWAIVVPDRPVWPRVWHGPGANPCDGHCSREWALRQIEGLVPDEVLATWQEKLRQNEPMQRLHVHDGEAIVAMGEGGPHMIRDRLVARLDAPEPGMGWVTHHEGKSWVFMIVDACTNPTVLVRQAVAESDPFEVTEAAPAGPNLHGAGPGFVPSSGSSFGFGIPGGTIPFSGHDSVPDVREEVPPEVSVVPVPASLGMMLAALGMLVAFGAQARRRGRDA